MNQRITYSKKYITTHVDNKIVLSYFGDKIQLIVHFQSQENLGPEFLDGGAFILNFQYNIDYLESFGSTILQQGSVYFKDICCASQMIILDLLNSKLEDGLGNIFMESKALELLVLSIKCEVESLDKCYNCKFLNNPYEKEKIFQAKEILLSNLSNPPIISELAKMVGMNQCYLKKGFKDIFQCTIFSFVQEQRISKAKLLLAQTDSSIGEIAELVGFSNTSNFTNSFKAFTGISPSNSRNN